MTDDPYLADVYPLPPMVSYRRPKNLKDILVRAKVPQVISRPKRKLNGMKRCPYDCLTCPYVQSGKTIHATATKYKHDLEAAVDCQTANIIYCLSCNKCSEQYIGETEQTLSQRFGQHRGYVRNKKLDQATGPISTSLAILWQI